MAISDGHGLPLAVHVASASPHETKLVAPTIERRLLTETPERFTADRAYDSDPLDAQICERFGVQLIAPHHSVRSRKATQDGRVVRRYRRRWKIERLFAWLHNFRRVAVRSVTSVHHRRRGQGRTFRRLLRSRDRRSPPTRADNERSISIRCKTAGGRAARLIGACSEMSKEAS